MQFDKSLIKYILDQFDAGVSPHQILLDIQSHEYLPTVTVAIIELCIRESGRVLLNQQTGDATLGNQPLKVGQARPNLPPAIQSALGPSTNIRRSGQRRVRFAEETRAESSKSPLANTLNTGVGISTKTPPTTVENLGDFAPAELWDYETEKYVLDAYHANKSKAEIWRSVRGLGYDITLQDIVNSMLRQGLHIKTVQEKSSKEKPSGHDSQKGKAKERQKEESSEHEGQKWKGKGRVENQ